MSITAVTSEHVGDGVKVVVRGPRFVVFVVSVWPAAQMEPQTIRSGITTLRVMLVFDFP